MPSSDDATGDLQVTDSVVVPAAALDWRFSRSSGPGGQGVNTADSRVELSVPIDALGLSDAQRQRLVLLYLPAPILFVVGITVDSSSHIRRTLENFYSVPHLVIYASFGIAAGVGLLGLLRLRGLAGGLRERARAEPFYAFMTLAAALETISGPSDEIWHRIIARDLTIWSIPHVLLIGAAEAMYEDDLVVASTATDAELAFAADVLAWVTSRFGAAPLYARVDVVTGDDGAPVLMELEAVEPYLYLAESPGSLDRLVAAILRRVT